MENRNENQLLPAPGPVEDLDRLEVVRPVDLAVALRRQQGRQVVTDHLLPRAVVALG
jgi:hypothetical protein